MISITYVRNLDIGQLLTFKTVVERGTFDSAAAALHVTPSAVSQRMKALEATVGRVLLQRVKPVIPTDSGRELLLLARQLELLTLEFEARLEGASTSGFQRIPIAVNADSLGTWMMPALAQVGDIATFDIHREDEEHSTALLHDGTVMAAVTSASKAVQGCRSTRLGTMRYRPMATRDFVERWFATGPTAKALSSAPVVVFDRKDEMQGRYLRRHLRGTIQPPTHYVPSTADFASAVLSGMGWGYISDLQFETFRANQRLVEFDPGSYIEVVLYWQQWKLSSPALDRVKDVVRGYAERHLH